LESVEIVRVKFRWPGKIIEFRNPEKLVLKRGDKVVVETFRGGTMVGEVSVPPRLRIKRSDDEQLTTVIRNASEQDLRTDRVTDEFRLDVKNFFRTRIQAQQMSGVKLIDVERADGGQTLILYYSCEQKRFDPRVLAKELGARFGMRIDMRTVGVRDAARLAGGIGKCGLSTCCSTWLPDFQAVSIRMAKDQGLSLDPESINGQCGRLLCCLGYENENYKALVKDMPKVGKMVLTPAGEGRVTKLDVLQGTVNVRLEDGSYETFQCDQVQRKFPAQAGGNPDEERQGERPNRAPRQRPPRDKKPPTNE
jgi:cell fate regulator YaaT (PSP1 superfamily)